MHILKRLSVSAIFLLTFVFAEDLIISGHTMYLAGEYHFDNVIITNMGVLAIVEYGGSNEIQGTLQLYCDSLFIDETSSINGTGAGGDYGYGIGGTGNSGSGDGGYGGGGGGGHAGVGGIGGGDNPGQGGTSYGAYNLLNRGSRGGDGYYSDGGAYGGGALFIQSRAALIYGSISTNGSGANTNGSGDGYYGGGGGGSGGMIWLDITNLQLNGYLSAAGGHGYGRNYVSSGGGGGGGGGRITITTESLIDTNFCSVAGGLGGDGGNGYPGLSGTRGEIYYLKTWLTSASHAHQELWYVNPIATIGMEADGDIYGYFYSIDQNPEGLADQTSNFTSENYLQLDSLNDGTWYFHAVPMDNSYLLLEEKHMTYQINIHNAPLEVSSPTHPEEGVWYANPNPVFNFESMAGIDDYYYIFDDTPTTIPSGSTGTHLTNPTVIIPGNPDGNYFMHIVGMDESGYIGSNAMHFQVNIGPPQPTLTILTDELNFPPTQLTMISSQSIGISNLGNGALQIDSVTFSSSSEYSFIEALPVIINPGVQNEYFAVQFQPDIIGEHNDTLYLHTNDPGTPAAAILLNGIATPAPTPEISLTQTEYDFGIVHMGESASTNIQLGNVGDAPLEITTISLLTGTEFSVNVPSMPFFIEPGNSADIEVIFSPTNDIAFYDILTIESNDPINPRANIIFDGIGDVELLPAIVVSPSTLNFGEVLVNQDSVRAFNIENTGNANLVLDGIIVLDNEHFAVNPFNLVSPIAPGESMIFDAIFSPSDSGMYSTIIYINSNDSTLPTLEFVMSGWGILPTAEISVDQTNFDFGNLELGLEAEDNIRIRNNGAELLTVDLQLDSEHFHLSQSYCEIPAFSLFDVTLYFTPIDTGSFSESITLISNSITLPILSIEVAGEAYFGDIIIIPEANPSIVSITDMPADQGGYVGIQFQGSDYDCCYNAYDVIEYSVWRELDISLFRSEDLEALADDPNAQILREDEYWEFMGSLPAVGFEQYGFTTTTIQDSTADGVQFNHYLVIAHTDIDDIQFISEPDSGYSVDNLSPSIPAGLSIVQEENNTVLITWAQNSEPDLSQYELYRDIYPMFEVSEVTLISTQLDTFYFDLALDNDITYYYRVLAKDYHGNVSAASDIVSTIIVGVDGYSIFPTEYQLAQNIPNPFNPSTLLQYGIPEKSYVSLIVYDLKGNIVKTIDSGSRQAGWHSYSWNGTTESGVQVPTGIYFARIQAGSYSQVVKMLFLK